jgi:succinoglycan biosynthesis transport protein ExoP
MAERRYAMELLPPKAGDPMSARDDDAIDVLAVFAVLRRRKWFILSVAAAGALIGLLLALRITPEYTSQATVVMKPPHEDPLAEDQAPPPALSKDPAAFNTQQQMIQSRAHIARVMTDLGLFDDPEFNAALRVPEEERVSSDGPLGRLLAMVPESWLVATGLADVAEPVETEAGATPELIRQRAVDAFQKKLEVGSEEESYVITINFTSVDPAKAALIANRTAELYVQSQIDAKSADVDDTLSWLREQIEALRAEVSTAEAAVERFRAENDLLDVKDVRLSEQELAEINGQLVMARANLAAKRAKLAQLDNLRSRSQLDAVAEVIGSPVIITLRQQEGEILRREAELAQEYGTRHPLMQQLIQEKASIQAKVGQEIARIIRALENEEQVTATQVQALEEQLAASKSASSGDRETNVQLLQLEREAEAARSLYQTLLQRFAELGAQQDFIRADVRVLTVAKTPEAPSSPGPMPLVGAGFTVAFVFGGLLALLRERLDHSLRGARETRAALGLPVLALVPKLGRIPQYRKPHRYLVAKPLSVYCEAIRSVYTSLRLGQNGRSPEVVLVTSALPGEGKTTFAVSLAVFAACTGNRTLLVDFDLRHQRVAQELDLLAGERPDGGGRALSLAEMVQRDPETGVDVLLIAGDPVEPTSFFDRPERIADLLAEVGKKYDIVIIDSAPAIVASETRVAALHADKVIYAVRWGDTSQVIARDGLEALEEAGADVAGVVITMVDLLKHAQYGYEDVAHYYGKYNRYGDRYYRS